MPVQISCARIDGKGLLVDLSLSGGFIETSLSMPAHLLTMVRVRSYRARHRVDLAGYVVRSDGRGVGIEWLDLVPVDLAVSLGFLATARGGRPGLGRRVSRLGARDRDASSARRLDGTFKLHSG